ncbi:unnamed protein product [Linum tenue]|uniref:Acid phosphatase 1 n=1 Tax=Linum tenue TaxID=586396 RepID=A0AAV0KWP5_9ROSI|nr:unnamed protein product [Linum tenue]
MSIQHSPIPATLILLLLLVLGPASAFRPLIRIPSDRRHGDDQLYCNSWRLSVEANNSVAWTEPPKRCADYVVKYFEGEQYSSDLEVYASEAAAYARTVPVAGDGKDAWVFDVDETLLSNLPYYGIHGLSAKRSVHEQSWNDWVDQAACPVLPASLELYKELKSLGFTIFILTGRLEAQRNASAVNLLAQGYSGWEKFFLREVEDEEKPASQYKSDKRQGLVDGGYRIHGSCGDQWSDLQGYAVAARSFKISNPLYFIP